MSFWRDLSSVAKGAIERDREKTALDLEDRRDTLKANRDFYIAQKTKKYEYEMKEFEDEQKKYKAIKAVNDKFSNTEGPVDKAAWGRSYLMSYKPELYNSIIKEADGDTELANKLFASQVSENLAKFKPSTTRDAVDDKIRKEVESITADYNTKIKNARGDSFLIGKLIGEKSNKIKNAEKQITEGAKGIEVSNSLIKETEPASSSESKLPFKFDDDKVYTLGVPKKFITESKIADIRGKLTSSDMTKSYSKEGVNTIRTFLAENDLAAPRRLFIYNKEGEVTGLKGPGQTLNEHLSLMSGGAVDSFTDKVVYAATNKKPQLVNNVLNESTVKAVIKDRLMNYTNISQQGNWFNDKENIVGIVPFSVVGVDNELNGTVFNSKAQKKAVGAAYVNALKIYTAMTNRDSQGKIIEGNQKYMNDVQTELLNLKGNTNNTAETIKGLMIQELTKNGTIKKSATDTSSSTTGPEKTMTVINTETNNTEIILDNEANRNAIKNNPKFKIQSESSESKIEPQPIEGDLDEQYTEGTEFDVKPQKPVASMTFDERREFEKKRSEEIKKRNRKRNEEFNEKIRIANEKARNKNTNVKSVKADLPDENADI